jgi:SAM-dependent methyltransferase
MPKGALMKNLILRPNAIPVYGFLSTITTRLAREGQARGGKVIPRGKVLDCGAGGPVPPVALFYQHGFEAWGIDRSEAQLDKARQFCREQGIELYLRSGDMRQIPFEDETFDYVYEHYSMCHLSKRDTVQAVSEMHRVLKAGGLCLLGVISLDSWPKPCFGEEREPGEYWMEEGGDGLTRHSMFTDVEADGLVSAWEIVSKEKHSTYLRETAGKTSLEEWMELYQGEEGHSSEEWRARYEDRRNAYRYAHLFYVLRKPE